MVTITVTNVSNLSQYQAKSLAGKNVTETNYIFHVVRKTQLSLKSLAWFMTVSAQRATACENTTVTVSCYEQDVIQIINAHYGRLNTTTCDTNIDPATADTECLVDRTREIVVNRSCLLYTSDAADE